MKIRPDLVAPVKIAETNKAIRRAKASLTCWLRVAGGPDDAGS